MTPSGPKAQLTGSLQGARARKTVTGPSAGGPNPPEAGPCPSHDPERRPLSELGPKEHSEEARTAEGSQVQPNQAGVGRPGIQTSGPQAGGQSRKQVQGQLRRAPQNAQGGPRYTQEARKSRPVPLCQTSSRVPAKALPTREGVGPPAALDSRTACSSPEAQRSQAEVVCGQAPINVRGPDHMGTA